MFKETSLALLSITVLASRCFTENEGKGMEMGAISHLRFPLITAFSFYFSYSLPLSLPSQTSIPHSVLVNCGGVWGKVIYRYEFHTAKCAPTLLHTEWSSIPVMVNLATCHTTPPPACIPYGCSYNSSFLLSLHFMLLFSLFIRK